MRELRGETTTFVTRCAWCDRYAVASDWVAEEEHDALTSPRDTPAITHGACPECAESVLRDR